MTNDGSKSREPAHHPGEDSLYVARNRRERLKVTRECRYGHGPLERVPGFWAFSGINLQPHPDVNGSPVAPDMFPNNTGFATALMRCLTCGYVELVDSDWEC